MRYMRRHSSDSMPACPMCHSPEDHLTRLALGKRSATVTKHCAKAVGLLMSHSHDSVKPRTYTHTYTLKQVFVTWNKPAFMSIFQSACITCDTPCFKLVLKAHPLKHKWINEKRWGCFKNRVDWKTEQSAMAIPGYEQQQCSHFPLVTHDATKDAFVNNVKKLNAVMTFPTWPQSTIFRARRHKTIQQTQQPQKTPSA